MTLEKVKQVIQIAKELKSSLSILLVKHQKLYNYMLDFNIKTKKNTHMIIDNNLLFFSKDNHCWISINISDINAIIIHEKFII